MSKSERKKMKRESKKFAKPKPPPEPGYEFNLPKREIAKKPRKKTLQEGDKI